MLLTKLNLNWTEKYRPKSVNEISSNKEEINNFDLEIHKGDFVIKF